VQLLNGKDLLMSKPVLLSRLVLLRKDDYHPVQVYQWDCNTVITVIALVLDTEGIRF
jgi:hypothetical protein